MVLRSQKMMDGSEEALRKRQDMKGGSRTHTSARDMLAGVSLSGWQPQ